MRPDWLARFHHAMLPTFTTWLCIELGASHKKSLKLSLVFEFADLHDFIFKKEKNDHSSTKALPTSIKRQRKFSSWE